jgi:hypothetical protein
MVEKTDNLLRTLTSPTKRAEKSYQEIIKLLGDHWWPKPLSIAERFRFYKRKQLEGESISDYVAVLRKLAEHCDFGDLPMTLERDLFVECVMKTFKANYCQTLVWDRKRLYKLSLQWKQQQHMPLNYEIRTVKHLCISSMPEGATKTRISKNRQHNDKKKKNKRKNKDLQNKYIKLKVE